MPRVPHGEDFSLMFYIFGPNAEMQPWATYQLEALKMATQPSATRGLSSWEFSFVPRILSVPFGFFIRLLIVMVVLAEAVIIY